MDPIGADPKGNVPVTAWPRPVVMAPPTVVGAPGAAGALAVGAADGVVEEAVLPPDEPMKMEAALFVGGAVVVPGTAETVCCVAAVCEALAVNAIDTSDGGTLPACACVCSCAEAASASACACGLVMT